MAEGVTLGQNLIGLLANADDIELLGNNLEILKQYCKNLIYVGNKKS